MAYIFLTSGVVWLCFLRWGLALWLRLVSNSICGQAELELKAILLPQALLLDITGVSLHLLFFFFFYDILKNCK